MNARFSPFALLFFAILIGGSGFLLSLAAPRLIESWSAKSWTQVQGHVTDVRVEEIQRDTGSKRWYEVTVVYAFKANGQLHQGDRLGLWPERLQRDPARELARNYPIGDPVQVYYDPADPRRSLLDRSVGGGTWLIAGIGVLVLALGLFAVVNTIWPPKPTG